LNQENCSFLGHCSFQLFLSFSCRVMDPSLSVSTMTQKLRTSTLQLGYGMAKILPESQKIPANSCMEFREVAWKRTCCSANNIVQEEKTNPSKAHLLLCQIGLTMKPLTLKLINSTSTLSPVLSKSSALFQSASYKSINCPELILNSYQSQALQDLIKTYRSHLQW